MWKDKKYRRILLACIFASLAAVVGFFVLSRTYIKNLVYKERLNQMEEITHQMFRNLEDVIGNRWADVNVQCNYLIDTDLQTDTDLYAYLQRVSALSNLEEKQITLLAVDSSGRYYTQQGSRGLLREMHYLEDDPEWVSYIPHSLTENDSRMVFLKRLDTPITLQAGTAQISLHYYGIAQSMEQLNTYFRCDAYDDHNSVYVLENNGLKLFNSNNTELLKGQNVYTVLSQMSYLHGSSFQQAKAALQEHGVCYSNAVLDGTEYFYSLKQMENAAWTLAFLVPADDVATNTQKLVDLVTAIIIGFATVFSVAVILILWRLQRDMQRDALLAEQETNLRLESYNQQLAARNAELKRAQEVAVDALQGAERASKAKTDFLSNMSHDIRTPMNAIIGITTLMKNELHEPDKLAEHLEKLEISGHLLLGIINDILDMSRIESGKTTLNIEQMDLLQQIGQVESVISEQAHQRNQEFRVVTTSVQHEHVLADPNRLNQILMNILSNSVKYTPAGGHIRLEVEELPRDAHYAKYKFIVQDDGIGMSDAYLKTIFDPFTREEKSGTNHVQGTGLGMAITKSVVDLMGGVISVESAPGHGSRFEVVLEFPIDTEAALVQKSETDDAPADTSLLCGMKFLCAEDNEINSEILQMLLESKGATCRIYPDGQQIVDAFAKVKPGDYDMILMDVQMPVMDGLEATRRIRSSENPLGKTIPILAMTANAFLEDMQKSKEAGMDEHLSKPVDIAMLEQVVRRFRIPPPPPINSGRSRFMRSAPPPSPFAAKTGAL